MGKPEVERERETLMLAGYWFGCIGIETAQVAEKAIREAIDRAYEAGKKDSDMNADQIRAIVREELGKEKWPAKHPAGEPYSVGYVMGETTRLKGPSYHSPLVESLGGKACRPEIWVTELNRAYQLGWDARGGQ